MTELSSESHAEEEDQDRSASFQSLLWIGRDSDGAALECMRNVLYSPRLQALFIWFPKCMCTTIRTLFLQMHFVLNPYLLTEQFGEGVQDVHRLHRRRRFWYADPVRTPVQQIFVVVRCPMDRLFSTFFDKHILQRQWHYLNLHTYRKFRCWLDVRSLPHTLHHYIRFIHEYHFLDIHDAPIVAQMPFDLVRSVIATGSCHVHALSMDDPRCVQEIQQRLHRIFQYEQIPLKRQKELAGTIRQTLGGVRNRLPRHSDRVAAWTPDWSAMTTTDWREYIRTRGFPQTETVLRQMPPDTTAMLERLYTDDDRFVRHLLQNPVETLRCGSTNFPNIWNFQTT